MKRIIFNLTFNYVKDTFYPIFATIILLILPASEKDKFFYGLAIYLLILVCITLHYIMRILQKNYTVHLNGDTRDWILISVIFVMLPYLL